MGKVVDGISTLWKDNSTPEQKVDLTPKHVRTPEQKVDLTPKYVRREKSINNNEYKQPEGVTPAWSAEGQPLEEPLKQQAGAQWKKRIESSEFEETTLEEASMEKFAPEGARSKSESSEHVTSESEMAEASLDVINKASWNQKTETQNSAQSKNHAQDTKSLSNSLKSQGPLRKQSMTTETSSKPGPSRQNIYTRRPWNHHEFKVLKAKTKGTTELTRNTRNGFVRFLAEVFLFSKNFQQNFVEVE
ncbi:hypothetical protein ANCCAN_03902 [Ancylostoma caninum]|uniref:Uncharacterized protein n=1 Tax=Ancylostoma caninum TaxID=29170 RepID=A0A368H0D1_ANCCA|nr:hypothetical protein ANCCAN_03902 [Ancylostoma caninum]